MGAFEDSGGYLPSQLKRELEGRYRKVSLTDPDVQSIIIRTHTVSHRHGLLPAKC